jgi:hypothetical protein
MAFHTRDEESKMSVTAMQVPVDATPASWDPVAIEELIGRVLARAHHAAHARDAPDEARAILHVAHSFADELTVMNPRFDRMRFIHATTTETV